MATFSPYSAATRSADNLPRVQWAARSRRRQSLSDLGQSGRHGTQLIQGGRRPPLGRRCGKQTVQPFHQEGGAFLAPSRPLERPGDAEAFRGLGTGGIHNGILPADLLLQPG